MSFYTNIRQYGSNILYIGYENGERVQRKLSFSPTLYTYDANSTSQSDHTSIEGKILQPIKFESIQDAKDFIKSYNDVSGFDIFGIDKFNYEYIAKNFVGDILYDILKIRTFYLDIEVFSGNGFPNTEEAKEKITAITIYDTKTKKFIVWGEENSPGGKYTPHLSNVEFKSFDNEIDMLNDFVAFWSTNYPDIVTGWYSRGFDIPYLINRIRRIVGEKTMKKLSPWGIVNEKKSNIKRFNQTVEETSYDIYGINELDYLDLYKKYTYTTSESFKLGDIAQKHLGETKVEFDGSLNQLYESDYQKYIEYNIRDVGLVHKLEGKLKFIELIVEVAYAGKVATFNDALGTVKYWEILIYNHLYEKNQHPPLKFQGGTKFNQYEGAFVKEPIVGEHKWVCSLDLTSLYPSIIRQVNIGPETLIETESLPQELKLLLSDITPEKLITKEIDLSILKKYDYSVSGNAKLYSKTKQSFLSELMEKFFKKRKEYKKQMIEYEKLFEQTHDPKYENLAIIYGVKQLAMKILINAAYGAVGNTYFQYYSIDNAEAVTVTGKVVIRWIERKLNSYIGKLLKDDSHDEFLNPNFGKFKDRIVYIDTDSVYISFDDLVTKLGMENSDKVKVVNFIDRLIQEKIEPFVKDSYQELYEYLNNFDNHMDMKREIISDKAVWTGKKRYFMNVYDKEGVRYEVPELKVMGIEVVKSSTPAICRDKLEQCLKIILREDNETLISYIENFRAEFYKLDAKYIAFPRSVNEISKFVNNKDLSVPMHVRAAINHNKLLQEHNLTKKYETILDGNKIKFVYLKLPNTLQDNVIGFSDTLPKEFKLEKYIDYETQFDKAFLAPLKAITDLINWKTYYENTTLQSMFF